MDRDTIIGLAGLIIGMTALIVTVIVYVLNRLEGDIKSIKVDSDLKMDALSKRMDAHASRIDQLYRMFVDLLKERKP